MHFLPIFLLFVSFSRFGEGATVFVDPVSGRDGPSCGGGRGSGACRTLPGARSVVRALLGSRGEGCEPVTVELQGFLYTAAEVMGDNAGIAVPATRENRTRGVLLGLGEMDSGRGEGCVVTWRNGTLVGGWEVQGWEKQGDVWVAPVVSQQRPRQTEKEPARGSPRVLRVGSVVAHEARQPNVVPIWDDEKYGSQFLRIQSARVTNSTPHHVAYTVTVTQPAPTSPFPPKGAEIAVRIFPERSWVNFESPAVVLGANSLLVQCGYCTPGSLSSNVSEGNRIVLVNHSSLLDTAGEFILRSGDGGGEEVVFWGEPGQDPNGEGAWLSGSDTILAVVGSFLRLQNLTFSVTSWQSRGFQQGFDETPAAVGSPDDGALVVGGGVGNVVEGCVFEGLGGGAVVVTGGNGLQVVDSTVSWVGQSGVMLVGSEETGFAQNTVLRDLRIDAVGRILASAGGVYVTAANGTVVEQCRISNCSRWGIAVRSNAATALSQHTRIVGNSIARVGLDTRDFGGISTIDSSGGANVGVEISGNCVRELVGADTDATGALRRPYYSWGIYLDNFSSHTRVVGNVVRSSSYSQLFFHGGHNNTASNNILAFGLNDWGSMWGPVAAESMRNGPPASNNSFLRNIVFAPIPNNASIVHIPTSDVHRQLFDYNLYFNPKFPKTLSTAALPFPTGNFSTWQHSAQDTHSLVADPLFQNPNSTEWNLLPNSPAIKLGFDPTILPHC